MSHNTTGRWSLATIIAISLGLLAVVGLTAAAATIDFRFATSGLPVGSSEYWAYGAGAILSSALHVIAPFLIVLAWRARAWTGVAAGATVWLACLAFSFTTSLSGALTKAEAARTEAARNSAGFQALVETLAQARNLQQKEQDRGGCKGACQSIRDKQVFPAERAVADYLATYVAPNAAGIARLTNLDAATVDAYLPLFPPLMFLIGGALGSVLVASAMPQSIPAPVREVVVIEPREITLLRSIKERGSAPGLVINGDWIEGPQRTIGAVLGHVSSRETNQVLHALAADQHLVIDTSGRRTRVRLL